jgi:hypothetical protein
VALAGAAWAAPASQDAASSRLANDPRLQTRLRLSAPGISLRELLPHISKATGASLTVAPTVAEEKVILFGPPRPAWETLNDLAALLDLRWERARDAATYRLTRSPQATQRIAALQLATAQGVQSLVDEHAAALAETPEQFQRRPERDRTRKILETPEFRTASVFYSLLSDQQKGELFTRKQLRFTLESLGPRLQAPLREIYLERINQEEQYYNSPEGLEVIRQAGSGSVHRRRREDLERNSFRIEALRADGEISVGINLGSTPTVASSTVDENGNPSFSTSGWPVTLIDTAQLWLLPPNGNPYRQEEMDRATVESFSRTVVEQKSGGEWVDRLRTLAETTGKPVLADYYRGAFINHPPAQPPADASATTNEQRLDRFCAGAQYLWWTRGSTLLLRKRDWYDQRTYEVSDAWLAQVAERLAAQNGAVTTADLPLIAELTPAQAAGLNALAQSGGVYDSGDGEAFQQLRSLAAGALRRRNRPLPVVESPGASEPLTLTLADFSLAQQRIIAEIGLRMGWLLTPEELRAFQLQISANARKSTANVQYIPIRFHCEFGPTRRLTSPIHLPFTLPHDHRSQLVVEKAP